MRWSTESESAVKIIRKNSINQGRLVMNLLLVVSPWLHRIMQKDKSSFAGSSSIANHSETIVPILFNQTTSVCCHKLERFSVYVARQIGFSDPSDCPQLCKLAYDYLRSTKGCEVNIYTVILGIDLAPTHFMWNS